ncbi:MAG: GntR family transcriptional regulator [Hydrogenophaga sp.]|nr:GntR family transcriptional regulator [Hydrogenophaga sp.]
MSASEDTIHHVISSVLLSSRIAPGAPLREQQIAAVFGVSRERVRKVLQRLGHEQLLDLVPNRGATAAAPTLEQARAIYDARRILEGGIVGHLANTLDKAMAKRLEKHLTQEEQAAQLGDRAQSIRLSAQFHVLLGEATGSDHISRSVNQLVSRTAMLVARYEPAQSTRCACEEHREIFGALVGGDGPQAMKCMHRHLALVETRLRPAPTVQAEDPIDAIRSAWQAQTAA